MASTSAQQPQPKEAQPLPLHSQHFYSVEYPGYVAPTSVPTAIRHLGGQAIVDNAFKRIRRNEARDNLVDLKLRPEDPFCHPVPGDVTSTNNLLLKVVKRKRRRLNASQEDICDVEGDFTAEIIGNIPKTLRFRSMVDFQYQPDMLDPIAQLRMSMEKLDAQSIKDFKFGPEKEDYTIQDHPVSVDPSLLQDGEDVVMEESKFRSNLRLFPPPVFSRQGIPQIYNFKQNPMAVVETAVDEHTGQERKRYIYKLRWKSWSVTPLSVSDKEVPTQPSKQVEEMRSSANPQLSNALQKYFEERPAWTKLALLNQFSYLEAREITNTKYLIPLFCYVFVDGPWRDTLIRFGYDPRTDVSSRFYQRIYFRNINNPTVRPSVTARVEAKYPDNIPVRHEAPENGSDRKSHIFDGVTQSSETASFQLIDIQDTMLKNMVETEVELREECDERDGWYKSTHIEGIKTVLRHKFFSLLEGHVATETECQTLLATLPESRTHGPTYTRKIRKLNKAKGALPPEEAAAARLRRAVAMEKAAESLIEK